MERAQFNRLVASMRLTAARAALATGDAGVAAELAQKALDHDPYDEMAVQVLMAARTAEGRPASALSAYAQLRQRLSDDLGTAPNTETDAVNTAVLKGVPVAGVVVGRPELWPPARWNRKTERISVAEGVQDAFGARGIKLQRLRS